MRKKAFQIDQILGLKFDESKVEPIEECDGIKKGDEYSFEYENENHRGVIVAIGRESLPGGGCLISLLVVVDIRSTYLIKIKE